MAHCVIISSETMAPPMRDSQQKNQRPLVYRTQWSVLRHELFVVESFSVKWQWMLRGQGSVEKEYIEKIQEATRHVLNSCSSIFKCKPACPIPYTTPEKAGWQNQLPLLSVPHCQIYGGRWGWTLDSGKSFNIFWTYTVIKGSRHSRPQTGCLLPHSPWARIIKLFPHR
jgi:hypothetical protein